MRYSRRDLIQLALVTVPGARLLRPGLLAAQEKPDSRVRGVQIGMNVPYNFGGRNMPADEMLQKLLALDVSAVEIRTQPVETFMGAQAGWFDAQAKDPAAAEALATWRASAPMDKARAFRKMYNDAGVALEIVKIDGIFALPDPLVDYVFTLAKALGARALSTEIAAEGPERIGKFADKHGLMIGYHGHAETGPEDWEKLFAYAKHNGANLDIGHFVAGNHGSPVPFLTKYHDRITHIHVKDRGRNGGPTVPFGDGETPVTEVLHLIRDNKWPIQATIEFEYKIPEGSDRRTELQKCMDYCRKALAS
jgi:sugar phosphate isomerase/epimerase